MRRLLGGMGDGRGRAVEGRRKGPGLRRGSGSFIGFFVDSRMVLWRGGCSRDAIVEENAGYRKYEEISRNE